MSYDARGVKFHSGNGSPVAIADTLAVTTLLNK